MKRAERRREAKEAAKKKKTFVFTQEDLDRFRREQYELAEKHFMKYLEEQRDPQITLQSFVNFLLVTLDYLETNFYCKYKGFVKFLRFAAHRMKWVGEENQDYFIEMETHFKEEFNLNVLEVMGLERVDE